MPFLCVLCILAVGKECTFGFKYVCAFCVFSAPIFLHLKGDNTLGCAVTSSCLVVFSLVRVKSYSGLNQYGHFLREFILRKSKETEF